ncbi:MAG: glutathione S-transferase family protein [Rhodospirillaceae bacterium]|jgi:glutathione S-transferase|nr:glutathione S-transferase family protein [Rhodospirillaceae bacterium]MBT5245191.1 glutathione S-transferase family protein [Rhodospirillaceae bacterium]MBT5561917.1 glutathione S-transferase family protein [Rhodospirillaceae bacterium]MBT6241965.1 glutathione S-transferase family protein [Rhodospirillaceae bacterium]MBT7138581.1 glutathione S-transferase family protein [Rhodospirillaceae bacterium]
MKIVSYKICPFVQRVTALLEAKHIPYAIEFISLSDKPQWFLDISPNGQVPVLITDDGTALFESDAIVEYIEEVYPTLLPEISPEDKALNRAWSYLASKNYLVQCSAQRSSDNDALKERSEKLGQAFDKIESRLGDTPFFDGNTIGMVDVAWLPLLHRANIIEKRTGYNFIGDRPKTKAWQKNLMATGLAEKSVASDFEEAFTNFYLSDQTFLGRGCDAVKSTADEACATGTYC